MSGMSGIKPGTDELRSRIEAGLPGASVTVEDESHLHAGHAGAAGGGGHFRVRVVWDGFAGRPRVARHRLVYDAVADWMPQRVHALAVSAVTADEAGGS